MVSWSVLKQNMDGTVYGEGFCLSTDDKPTSGVGNGSKLLELTAGTGKTATYYFDGDGGAWVKET